ncbi:monooxygenase [Sphingobium sp. 22B]|uniref:flavin-containing monooxygenase n=1 Tax=unclassified Sphingobium TaxID=2611147 RepID=UPI0007816D1B|nr:MULTISPECIES: NAD(P)/FAD-dependent oxidoreductase [unclassified Sphingobium]KXU30505.1 monooxygenase [Sphingobium sp. AM]KYC30764.1 monooxygenase [Sphingobium sp. 22B]OAP30061.1 monooxygenase [Sphingobium sp. 20006FA]
MAEAKTRIHDVFDSYLPVTIDDAEIERIVEKAELPSLLAALAQVNHDLDLIPASLKPPHTKRSFIPLPHGGLDEAQQKEARRLIVEAIRQYRDRGSVPKEPLSRDEMTQLVGFLITRDPVEYGDLLRHEIAQPDTGAPDWTAGEIAPERDFRVIVLGGGITGIATAYRLRQAGVDFVVLEKNSQVGGAWWENTYPGCRLDTQNYAFSYTFAQKIDWPQQFSTQPEILNYLVRVSHDYDIRDAFIFNTVVESAIFDEEAGEWVVTAVTDGETRTYRGHAIVNGTGLLNAVKLPDIPGVETFAGPAMHSAQWDHGVDLTGKRVGIIGTGASAYQIAPSIADQVGQLSVFQRSAPWLLPTPTYLDDISPEMIWLFRHIPAYARWYRFWQFWLATEGRMPIVTVDPDWTEKGTVSKLNAQFRAELVAEINRQLADRPDLVEKVTPTYPPGAKRLLRDNGQWARTLRKEHVELVTGNIERIVPEGVVTADGRLHEFDVLIYATGFRTDEMFADIEVRGRDGIEIHDYWNGDPRAYNTIMVPHFPNLFIPSGPGAVISANGSAIYMTEVSLEYAVKCLKLMLENGWQAIEPTEAATKRFTDWVEEANTRRAWGIEGVGSWYKNSTGRTSKLWPFELLDYWNLMQTPVLEDYAITALPDRAEAAE